MDLEAAANVGEALSGLAILTSIRKVGSLKQSNERLFLFFESSRQF